MSHTISQSLLPEFDHEMANTRKTLERVPEGLGDFKVHDKSMTLARLAGHVSEMPQLAIFALEGDHLDVNPGDGAKPVAYQFHSKREALAKFDGDMKKARQLLADTSDAHMMETWTLKAGGHTVLSMPRIAVFRGFVLSHMIHHRAQLGVYLRLNDVAVPAIYGPSADEQ